MGLISDVAGEIKKLDQSKTSLRKFGLVMTGALGAIGALIYFKGSVPERGLVFLGIAAVFLVLGLTLPIVLRPVHKLWMGLASVIGWFMSRLVLSIVFYVAVTPVGVMMRLLGKDLLDEKIDKDATSYWIKRQNTDHSVEKYKKLY